MMYLIAYVDKVVAAALYDLSNPFSLDNRKAEALIGRPLKNLDEMVIDTAQSLIEYKAVSPPKSSICAIL
jgi:hypothetical protein